MKSQKENIRVALENGHRITSLDALQWFGCARLAARIQELRPEGKKSFACYSMRRKHA